MPNFESMWKKERVHLLDIFVIIIILLTLIYLKRNNLFQLSLFHTGNISQLIRMLLLLIYASLLWANLYNGSKKNIIDKHTPLRTREMPRGPLLQWYNTAGKRQRSYCERMWIKTGLCVHYEIFQISKIQPKMPLPLLNLNIRIKSSKHAREIKVSIQAVLPFQILSIHILLWRIVLITFSVKIY